MRPSYRIEIVIEEPLVPQLKRLLRELGAPGFTIIPRAGGSGDRGIRRGDELAGDSSNCVFIVACEDEALVTNITEAVRPILSRSGGICLVTPCQALSH